MLRTLFIAISLLTISTGAMSQAVDSTKNPPATTFSGSVDVYYRYNFSDIPSFHNSNNYTSFTNSQNSFELGMASIRADHSFGKVSATADLGFGRRAQEFSYNDNGLLAAVKQLYLTYSPMSNLKFTAGKWATHIGYEVLDAYANRNYSMDYMFSYGPFFHTGLKAELTVGKSLFMLGVANPNDYTTSVTPYKNLIAQFATASHDNNWKFYLNFMTGRHDTVRRLTQLDAVITGTISSKFSVGYNGTIQWNNSRAADQNGKMVWGPSQDWWGSAVYLNYDPFTWFGLTLRSEYFKDDSNLNALFSATGSNSIIDNTLSFNFRINSLTIIPELRYDAANQQLFKKNDGSGTKGTGNVLVAAVYKF